jgi:battenin
VLISRSSGTLWNPGLKGLWLMPLGQVVMLIFFTVVAVTHFWYDYGLLVMCVIVGLFGGFVYINAFKLISEKLQSPYREIAMSGATVSNTLGIAMATGLSLWMQACLYQVNDVTEKASMKCY